MFKCRKKSTKTTKGACSSGISMEAVAVRAGYNVFIEVEDNILLIVGDPQGI
jgi:hypothetical protein